MRSLQKPTISKVSRLIDLLRQFGEQLRMPYSKSLGHNLFELRIRGQQGIRILYIFYKQEAVLLHGFVKKAQKTPLREIETALTRMKELTSV